LLYTDCRNGMTVAIALCERFAQITCNSLPILGSLAVACQTHLFMLLLTCCDIDCDDDDDGKLCCVDQDLRL